MPLTSRQRDLKRRQRRQRKIRELKRLLAESNNTLERRKLLEKIRKFSPWDPILDEY